MQITTKFSAGDRAYFPIYATANIYAVDIAKVYLRYNAVFYDLVRVDTDFMLEGVPETDVCTFVEARTKLMSYLQTKLTDVTNLVAP